MDRVGVTTARMQWEVYPSFIRMHPDRWEAGLRGFLADARALGLTEVNIARFASQIVVIAVRPGDPEACVVLV